jgi:hypothetical protein
VNKAPVSLRESACTMIGRCSAVVSPGGISKEQLLCDKDTAAGFMSIPQHLLIISSISIQLGFLESRVIRTNAPTVFEVKSTL